MVHISELCKPIFSIILIEYTFDWLDLRKWFQIPHLELDRFITATLYNDVTNNIVG